MSALNKKQKAAAARLGKALDACHKAGLTGGVYEGQFRLWPVGVKPDPRDCDRFFEAVERVGETAWSLMTMDGGAGV